MSNNKIIMKAKDLDGYLTEADKKRVAEMNSIYNYAMNNFAILNEENEEKDMLIGLYNEIGAMMQDICKNEPNIQVYSFESSQENHSEASRLIAKLRNTHTGNHEFVYYIQRAYEMIFKLAYRGNAGEDKNYMIVKTPVTEPIQNYAVHKLNNVDNQIGQAVMCVMLRGALLPSMIVSKEIQEYSSYGYVTPFALFKISRDGTKREHNMEYVLDLEKSYFNLEQLNGKDLIFADPMNATGGSIVTVVKYLMDSGVKPRSIRVFNVISALKGSLRAVRALENCQVYTLWMDPVLNEFAYIMPGLGDAGDRINGQDSPDNPRNIIQLIADYGFNIACLYRDQIKEIGATVLREK